MRIVSKHAMIDQMYKYAVIGSNNRYQSHNYSMA